jgi:hypothetical protein
MQSLQDYDRWQHRRGGAVRTFRHRLTAALVASAFLFASSLAVANEVESADDRPSDSQVVAKEAGIGLAAGVSTLIYTPIKLVYSIGGVVIGGLAWVFSGGDSDVAKTVITPAVAGDYVLTARHLQGKETLEFFGREPGYRPEEEEVEQSESSAEIAGLPSGW